MGLFFGIIIIEKIVRYRLKQSKKTAQKKCLHMHREVEFINYPDRYELYRCVDCNAHIYIDMDDGSEEISDDEGE